MLAFIKEKQTLWDYLKTAGKPVVLYGTGDGADKVIDRLAEENIAVAGIFASDEFVRGQRFRGFAVRKFSELLRAREPLIVLIAFASEREDVMDRFYELARIHETYAPHVPVFADDEAVTPAWLDTYEAELQQVYEGLADETSRNVFADILNYRISGKLSYLWHCVTDRGADIRELFPFGSGELYVDLGAYDGDTVQEFLDLSQRRYKKIYAVEPDSKNFKKLTTFVEENKIENICCLQAGVWNSAGELELTGNGGRQSTFWKAGQKSRLQRHKKVKTQIAGVVSVDRLLGDEHADYMKFDVEGVEKEALEGAKGHLTADGKGILPKLLVAAYHHDKDIFVLPLFLWKLQPKYRLYLRKHPYVPDWEINIFAK